jgi:hypothetical protein
MQPKYNPSFDRTALKVERVAIVRIFFYGEENYFVPPAVETEH